MISIDDMVLFSKLVELKSFTAVSETLLLSRSLVSKRINRLEDHLGVQLLNRSTRRLEITEAGRIYFEYCRQMEAIVQEAESAVGEIRQRPRGTVHVNAPVTFGQYLLPPIITQFLLRYPEVNIDLSLSDKFVDIIEGGYDLVIRIGSMGDSTLRARQIGSTKLCVFAHKDYLEKHGTPLTPQDLQQHNCLIYRYLREWSFMGPMGKETVHVRGNFSAENGVPLYKAAQSGLGIAILPNFILDAMSADDMVILLRDYSWDTMGIFAVYPGTRKPPLNTRVLIDFLVKALG